MVRKLLSRNSPNVFIWLKLGEKKSMTIHISFFSMKALGFFFTVICNMFNMGFGFRII